MKKYFSLFLLISPVFLVAQVFHFEENNNGENLNHRIMMDQEYFIETVYSAENGVFILTRGGYYTASSNEINVVFEFNSNYTTDSLKTLRYNGKEEWENVSLSSQVLDGKWLMAGRVNSEGEQRRGLTRSRKTMKFLIDGYFQWTAFDTKTYRFSGAGGGQFQAKNNTYEESIEYFSRDNSKIGNKLPFTYLLKKEDWYHQGLNSRGEPLHEIWHKRTNQ